MSEIMNLSNKFFKVGGTLGGDAASYVRRPLDNDLLRLTLAGEYCNVLAARQMGKSSLMVRTAEELKKQGVSTAIIDITSIGSLATPNEWYLGLVSRLVSELKLEIDSQAWWKSMEPKSPVQRFSDFLRDILLEEIKGPIVIFIDEIDSTLKLNFTDDFFAAIRAIYNARSRDEIYKRLAFVLLGVARPGDLIKDRTRTPYNIGVNIDVTDFKINELDSFRIVLDKKFPNQGKEVLEWVLDWTGGQPYLTQKLCSEVVEYSASSLTEVELSDLVEQLFLGDKAREETNLVTIRDRVNHSPYAAKMLRIYRRVLARKQVLAEERSIEQNELKLTGLVKVNPQGVLQVRNRIYAYVFDVSWVRANMSVTSTQRLTVVTSIVAVLAIAVAGYFYYQQQNQTAEIQARTYVDNFNNSNSAEVRITSLAGLFRLRGQYTEQANRLFDALNQDQKLALFNLTTPSNVGDELVVVVENIYQSMENSPDGNALLKTMASILEQTPSIGATSLALEINTWLDGRDAVAKGGYPLAISLYIRAYEYSQEGKRDNVAILMERASVYTLLTFYAEALADYDNAVSIDASIANEVQNAILGDPALADYWRKHQSSYPNLLRLVAVPTKIPISNLAVTSTSTRNVIFTQVPTATAYVGSLPTEINSRGVHMMLVAAGEFIMGSDYGLDDEKPSHVVYLDAYYIDKYEVTNALYKICSDAGVCSPPSVTSSLSPSIPYYGDSEFNDSPPIFVFWNNAKTYCEWRHARLPTEAEWEKAARGTDGRTYPWGEGIDCTKANYFGSPGCARHVMPVGSYEIDVSPYGVYDMAGNVSEWVSDWFSSTYYRNSPLSNPLGPDKGQYRVLRGGSWSSYQQYSSTYRRRWSNPNSSNYDFGFRCARDASP